MGLVLFFAVLVVLGVMREEAPSTSTTIVTTTTTLPADRPTTSITFGEPVGLVALEPSEIVVSSELSADHTAQRLIDGDASTAWRDDSMHGDEATIELMFEQPVTVFAVVIQGLADDEEFHRSHRMRRFRLSLGSDTGYQEVEMPDTREPFRVDLGGVATSVVTIEVLSTYPSESTGGEPALEELAVAEVVILGKPKP